MKASTDMFLGVCIGVVIGHLITIVALATANPIEFTNDNSRVQKIESESVKDPEPLRSIQPSRGYISHDASKVYRRPEGSTVPK